MVSVAVKVQAGLFALLFLLYSSLAHGEVYMLNAKQFAQENQAIEIQAYADDSPASMFLEWTSNQNSGRIEMMPAMEHWSATISSQDVQNDALHYTITADYSQNPSATSPEYVVYLCPEYTMLKPQALILKPMVLAKKKWNSDNDAFGLVQTEDGPEHGPASIACHNDKVYLLDSVKSRVLCFDQTGASQPEVALPTTTASDLAVDPADSSLIVVSQREDIMFRIRKGRTSQILPMGLNRKLAYPSKFSYDSSSETLLAEDAAKQNRLRKVIHQGKHIKSAAQQTETNPQVLSEARGNNILLRLDGNPQIFAVTFDKPVFCIEETLADSKGVVWILFNLEGDYQMRRLVRIDTVKKLAQTAETDIWFSFDATRRMALTRNGVVLFAGNSEEGRIVKFDYAGGVQ
jgi:hypothetical protein